MSSFHLYFCWKATLECLSYNGKLALNFEGCRKVISEEYFTNNMFFIERPFFDSASTRFL